MIINHITITSLTDCQRLFHGRGHAYANLSHVNVDWYEPVVLITLYEEVDANWLLSQAQQIKALIPSCRSVRVQYRCRFKAPSEVLLGDNIESTIVQEKGLRFHIQLGRSQNSGLFLDMTNGRQWLQQHSAHKSVLNLFSYTCAFSIAAIAGGANSVVNIDMSKAALSVGRENHRLNNHDLSQVKFEGVDIFKSNSRIKKYGPYDVLVCDPPSFQKGSIDIERDYKKIIKRIPVWMKPGADLLLCLNSPNLSEQFLLDTVEEYCPDCIFQNKIENPAVFKEAEKGKGLKTLYFKYLPQ